LAPEEANVTRNSGGPPTLEPADEKGPPVLQPVEGTLGCPVCREPMQFTTVDEIAVDFCSEHGLWLDLGEEEALLQRARRLTRPGNFRSMARAKRRGYAQGYTETGIIFTSESSRRFHKRLADHRKARLSAAMAAHRPEPGPSSEQRILCPVCGEIMRKQVREDRYGNTPDIVVDLCPQHGMWLDTGELDVLVDRAEDEGRRAATRRVRQAYKRGLEEGRRAADWD
jgi:Zn-finger nucleic acid-binding protein